MGSHELGNVAFAGLGAMGFGMATHLLKSGYNVTGFDVYEPSLAKFSSAGGKTSTSPKEAAKGSKYFVCMVANAKQADSVLFDPDNGAVSGLATDAVIIICSTVPAAFLQEIQSKLEAVNRTDISLIDSPVSGGTIRAANGDLTILSSGTPAALELGRPVQSALSRELFVIPGGIGAASNVKMVNQLLAGVHIAAAAEAMGLAARLGLQTRECYEVILKSMGSSWMFGDRVPHMLDNDWTPKSALDIFVKDMGIVTSAARAHNFPVFLSSAAEQLYISGSSQGYGREDDAGVVRVFLPNSVTAVHDQAATNATQTASVMIIIQLLSAVHLCAAAEAMALGARLGLDTASLYSIIKTAAGSSAMFLDRVPTMLKGDWTQGPRLKDVVAQLGGVLDVCKSVSYAAPLSAAAHQVFLTAASHGWTAEADAGVVRVWELMAGVSVSGGSKSA